MASYRESWEEEYHVEAHSLLNLVLSLKFGVRKYDVEGSGCSHWGQPWRLEDMYPP